MANMGILANLRQAIRRLYTSGPNLADQNLGGDLLVAQALPERTELVKGGRSYLATIATANAFTYVAGWPTTRAELIVYNNAPPTSKICLHIDSAWMYGVTSMAAAQPISLVAQVVPPGIAAPTDGTTTVIQTSLSAKSVLLSRAGSALFALANTAFCVANHWDLLASTNAPMTTNLGQGVVADLIRGMLIIPPGAALGLAGIAGTAAGTAIIGVKYHEAETDLF